MAFDQRQSIPKVLQDKTNRRDRIRIELYPLLELDDEAMPRCKRSGRFSHQMIVIHII